MYDCYITFRSVTTAQRGEALLLRYGFRVHLRRAPKFLSVNGCGYALMVPCRDLSAAGMLLLREGVNFVKLYRPGQGGGLEEVRF